MPNHVHGIIWIADDEGGEALGAVSRKAMCEETPCSARSSANASPYTNRDWR